MEEKHANDVHPLRAARHRQNLTIEGLAEDARVGASTVWRAEHGYPINAESRRRLCTYFGMTAQDLGLVDLSPQENQELPAPAAPASLKHSQGNEAATAVASLVQPQVLTRAQFPTGQPLDQQLSFWLALGGGDLVALLEAGWTSESILSSLRVVLESVQGLPDGVRNQLLQVGGAAILNDITLPGNGHISQEERLKLSEALRKSVADAWHLSHCSNPAQILVIGQTQLHLLRQVHTFIDHELRCSLYAAVYNLIGSSYLSQGRYDEAQREHEKAYMAALEGADIWNITQSLNWQAIVASVRGDYRRAIKFIEAALRVLGHQEEDALVRLRAHLLADWAYNEAMLREEDRVQERLNASVVLLERLGPDEEFDLARWHQIAGSCQLMKKDYVTAIGHLKQSLAQLPSQWLARRILTLIPLAEAYARKREMEASIGVAEHLIPLVDSAGSAMLYTRFTEYQQVLLQTFPHERRVQSFVSTSRRRFRAVNS